MTSLYVAGPMTGLPEFNYPAFNTAADLPRERGYTVFNPTLDRPSPAADPPDMTWVDYMRAALAMVIKADGIALLGGWENSRGARLEVDVARALGMQVRRVAEWPGVTQEAAS